MASILNIILLLNIESLLFTSKSYYYKIINEHILFNYFISIFDS